MNRGELRMHHWRLLDLDYPDAPSNVAFEEALARCIGSGESPPTFRVWRNRRAAVIGENQSARIELHLDVCRELGVDVVRRFTGGGAVYHDLGNLNYSVCVPRASQSSLDFQREVFQRATECVVTCLKMLDLDSVRAPVNTVIIDGRKISGGAGAVRWGAVFYHGSILVGTDLEMVWKVLRREQPSADTRLVQSTRVSVTSMKKELGADMPIDRVKSALSKAFEETFDARLTSMPATRKEQQGVSGLVREKYGAEEWNLKM